MLFLLCKVLNLNTRSLTCVLIYSQENLLNFDKENISQKAIQTIRSKYRDNQEFKPEKIMVASKAAESKSLDFIHVL